MGGAIRAGEKGSPIVFVDRMIKEETNKEGQVVLRPIYFLKYYTVFNWCQTKGLPEKVPVEKDNQQIPSAEEYYATAFHELTHWTGGAGRLCRDSVSSYHIGKDVRSQEELVAEMGAAFFCQIAALDTSQTLQNTTAYIQSWLKPLQNNPKWVLKASTQAREAVEYVMTGKLPEAKAHATAAA